MSSILRNAVSKKKRRYQKNGFDLDLTYVTPRIIAMGFPSENVEAAFRNPMKEVLRFLDSFHKDHYKVYNLCSERNYDHTKFYNRVEVFPFDDHNAPPFELILQFCQNVSQWLDQDEKNIAVIHCKAGKGRTGLMISAWMVYSREWATAKDALTFYAAMRTYNQKGVTIPSQIRYVHYFEESLNAPPVTKTLLLNNIVFHTLPKVAHINDVSFTVHVGKTVVYNFKDEITVKRKEKKGKKEEEGDDEETATFSCENLPLCGDIKVEFAEKGSKMFTFWFCSSFVKEGRLLLKKEELDKAHKDSGHKNYHANFRLELVFSDVTTSPDQAHAQASSIPAVTSASADASLTSSSSPTSSPSDSNHHLAEASNDATQPILSSSIVNGEWLLNKGAGEEAGDVSDDPNELSERLLTLLLRACKSAARGGTLICTHTYMVRTSPVFQEFLSLVPRLAHVKLEGLSPSAAVAFWLNVHNMLTVHSRVLLADMPKKKEGVLALHQSAKYRVCGRLYSGSDIEIGVMRTACSISNESPFIGTAFAVDDSRRVYTLLQHEPMIVFALYRGTSSCPDVRVYTSTNVDKELEDAARAYLAREGFADTAHKDVWLPKLLFWHKAEFGLKDQGMKDALRKFMQISIPDFGLKFNQPEWDFEMHPYFAVEEKVKAKDSKEKEKRRSKHADAEHSERKPKVEVLEIREDYERDREREKRHKHEHRRERSERSERKERHKDADKEKDNKDAEKEKDKDEASKHRHKKEHADDAEKEKEREKRERRKEDKHKHSRTDSDGVEKAKSRSGSGGDKRHGHKGERGHEREHHEKDGHHRKESREKNRDKEGSKRSEKHTPRDKGDKRRSARIAVSTDAHHTL